MTQDNEDAALELAFYEWLAEPQPAGMTAEEWNAARLKIAFIAGGNAARKPLEEDVETLFSTIKSQDIALEKLQQQLLATQEAYQRAADYLRYVRDDAQCWTIRGVNEALANPPSLEAPKEKE